MQINIERTMHLNKFSYTIRENVHLTGEANYTFGFRLLKMFAENNSGLRLEFVQTNAFLKLLNGLPLLNMETIVPFSYLENMRVCGYSKKSLFSGISTDMKEAISYAEGFVKTHSQEITFVGHSKGGGEAMANAVATNRNAITFNLAKANLPVYGLGQAKKAYSATMIHYVVEGEILNSLFGDASIGTTVKANRWR